MSDSYFYFKTEAFSVGYDGNSVVSDIELGINRGEILSLIGPNGAGKTTILKSIIRQLEPISGVAVLDEEMMSELDLRRLARKLSVLLTDRPKTELMTVRDIVATGRYPYTGRFGRLGSEDNTIVDEAMRMVKIYEWKDRDFDKISDGQKQRVMLARALAQQPEIIVLDEPTSFLDIKFKMEFLSILRKLSRENKLTVIMSLHEVELAGLVSDRIACFRDGRLDRFGRPDEIFDGDYILKLYDIDEDELTPQFKQMILRMASHM